MGKLNDIIFGGRGSVVQEDDHRTKVGASYVGERRHRCKDGTLVDVEIGVITITYGDREVFCSIVHDVTERKEREPLSVALIVMAAR